MVTGTKGIAAPTSVLILVQNLSVPFDRRVWQEAVALAKAGYEVHVACPASRQNPARRECIDGISIYRYRGGPEARRSWTYLIEYLVALLGLLRLALLVRLRHRIAVVQICNPPDLLFLVALPLVALGACLIYDHHDACPELLMAKGHARRSWQVRLARACERLTYRFCHGSVETNESYRAIAHSRGHMDAADVFVVRSAPDSARFEDARPDARWRFGRTHLVGYVGVMGIQDGLDYLVDAAALIISDWRRRDIQFVLAGDGPERRRLHARAIELGIGSQVVFAGRLTDKDLGGMLSAADVCVSPDEVNEMNNISTMNKVLEYMALGKPVVQFDLQEGRISAANASLYAAANDARSLATCIIRLVDDPVACRRMGEYGRRRLTTELSWDLQVPSLLSAYERGISHRRAARGMRRVKADAITWQEH